MRHHENFYLLFKKGLTNVMMYVLISVSFFNLEDESYLGSNP